MSISGEKEKRGSVKRSSRACSAPISNSIKKKIAKRSNRGNAQCRPLAVLVNLPERSSVGRKRLKTDKTYLSTRRGPRLMANIVTGGGFDGSLAHFHCGAFAVFDGTWSASTIVAVTCTVAFCRLFSSVRSAINSKSRVTRPAAYCRLSRDVIEHHDSVTHPRRHFAVSRSTTGKALRLRDNHGPSSGKVSLANLFALTTSVAYISSQSAST